VTVANDSRRRNGRRTALARLGGLLALPLLSRAAAGVSPPVPAPTGCRIRFPADEGSHPVFRTEWWYVTGWLDAGDGPLGFQITFFRTRLDRRDRNPSRFTPGQILIAHAAISDPREGRLVHDQRVARAGFDIVAAAEGRLDVRLDRWTLRAADGGYSARIPGTAFELDLRLAPTQAPLLNGRDGYSRKGPSARSASCYYSQPHLRVEGTLRRSGRAAPVRGTAWLDHEWSSDYVEEGAVGWDWTGLNLADGGALMAFRMRAADGSTVWAGGTWRSPDGRSRVFAPDEIAWEPGRRWRSPHTGTEYPVVWRLRAGPLALDIVPLMDDQENDTRASTGTIYWEGAVRALQDGRELGRGYLELTGYWRPLVL